MGQARQCVFSILVRQDYCQRLRLISMQTLLEKIKTLYTDTPGLTPDRIGPTVGQNSECAHARIVLYLSCERNNSSG